MVSGIRCYCPVCGSPIYTLYSTSKNLATGMKYCYECDVVYRIFACVADIVNVSEEDVKKNG